MAATVLPPLQSSWRIFSASTFVVGDKFWCATLSCRCPPAINNSIKIRKCCSKLVQTFVASESSKWFPCENRDKAFNVSYCGPRSQIKANFCDHCTLQPRFLKTSLTQPNVLKYLKPSMCVRQKYWLVLLSFTR